jgi:cell division protein FtsL
MVLLSVSVVAGLFAVAFAHAQLVENQRELDEIRLRISELEAEKAQIERAVDEASSPAVVVDRATELGLIRAEEPVYLAAVTGTGGG